MRCGAGVAVSTPPGQACNVIRPRIDPGHSECDKLRARLYRWCGPLAMGSAVKSANDACLVCLQARPSSARRRSITRGLELRPAASIPMKSMSLRRTGFHCSAHGGSSIVSGRSRRCWSEARMDVGQRAGDPQ